MTGVHKTLGITGLLLVLAGFLAAAQAEPVTNVVIRLVSATRQFYVEGVPAQATPNGQPGVRLPVRLLPSVNSGETLLRLYPAYVVVYCERIKQALLRELTLPDTWRSQIEIAIRFTPQASRPIQIQPRYLDGAWRYALVVPDEVERRKFVRAIVEVMLMEMVNRRNGPRFTEIPLWLTEGMTRHLMALGGPELVPQPNSTVVRAGYQLGPLAATREFLRTHAALTFTQLSQPTPEMLEGDAWSEFQVSAHLLTAALLGLDQSHERLHNLLMELPHHMNWQMAFLAAFRPYFQSLLDVEKWWALVVADVQFRDPVRGWTREATWQKLDEILHLPAHVRHSTNDLPVATELSLQRFIELYDFTTQRAILSDKIGQLRAFRLRARPEVVAVVDDYLGVLEQYIERRSLAGFGPEGRGGPAANPYFIARDIRRKLDVLDLRRQTTRQRSSTAR